MKIILQENVEKLGTRGQVVEVAEGYARNYLLPRSLAIPASTGNMKRLEKIRATLAKKEATEKGAAELLAQQLSAASVSIARKAGENDQLFGSVTAADIAGALEAQGFIIDKRRIQLAEPIKVVSEHQVPVKLHHDVTATLKVSVTREA
ncbi:MAG: 50S ribosomal protein L9 [Candidatus Acidiferrales bacterium]